MRKYINNPQQEFFQKVVIKKIGNISNKKRQDVFYSEISASDTGLKILIVQSRGTPAYL